MGIFCWTCWAKVRPEFYKAIVKSHICYDFKTSDVVHMAKLFF